MPHFDLIIRNAKCVVPNDQNQLTINETDIAVLEGRVAQIGGLTNSDSAETTFEAQGLHVLPGLIDSQVHFREPGHTHKEDLATGSLGALAGGITGVLEMPNTRPPVTDVASLEDKVQRATNRMWTHFGFFLGASPSNVHCLDQMENTPGCCGIKVFMGSSTGNLLIKDDDLLDAVLSKGSRMVAIHSEDEQRLVERFALVEKDPGHVHMHPVWRDEESALRSTQRLLKIARKHNRRVHVLHITTRQELDLLKQHKDLVTLECTPQHLTLESPECYERLGSLAQMNPPIRDKSHKEALWKALNDGTVDVIGSDHAPHTKEEKAQTYPKSPSGLPGVQTTLPLMLDAVHNGRLSLTRLVEVLAQKPADLYKIQRKGRIKVGFDADFTIVDLKQKATISNSWIRSRCGYTPFDGMPVTGWPKATIIGGQIAMREDEILGSPLGKAFEYELK